MSNTAYLTHAFADNLRFAKGRLHASPGDASYNEILIPRFSFVKSVWLWVIEATDVKPAECCIGWSGNKEEAVDNGFMTIDVAEPTKVGMKRAQKDALTTFEGKYFNDASGVLTFTFAKGDASTYGNYRVFAEYILIH